MPEEYSEDIQEAAEDLYVIDGLTYDQVSKATEVSVSTLKRWGQAGNWKAARTEHRADQRSIRRNQVKLRAAWLRKAVNSSDPQDAYAYTAVEKALAGGKKADKDTPAEAVPVATDRLKEIKTPADAVAALETVIELKVAKLLSQPEALTLRQVKDMNQTIEMIEGMKVKYNLKTDTGKKKKRKLDAGTMQEIKDIYGVS